MVNQRNYLNGFVPKSRSQVMGNLSIGVSKTKFGGNNSAALVIMLRYDWRIVTSATPAISPISKRRNQVIKTKVIDSFDIYLGISSRIRMRVYTCLRESIHGYLRLSVCACCMCTSAVCTCELCRVGCAYLCTRLCTRLCTHEGVCAAA